MNLSNQVRLDGGKEVDLLNQREPSNKGKTRGVLKYDTNSCDQVRLGQGGWVYTIKERAITTGNKLDQRPYNMEILIKAHHMTCGCSTDLLHPNM